MIVPHKFDIGEYVFKMHENKVGKFRIIHLGIQTSEKGVDRLYYSLQKIGGNYDESDLFKTKEELLKSL